MAKLDGILKSWMEERGNQINIKPSFLFCNVMKMYFLNAVLYTQILTNINSININTIYYVLRCVTMLLISRLGFCDAYFPLSD